MTFLQEQQWRRLQVIADQADRRYAETIKSRTGKDRWTLTQADNAIPEIKAAYRAKVNADGALLTFMRYVATTV